METGRYGLVELRTVNFSSLQIPPPTRPSDIYMCGIVSGFVRKTPPTPFFDFLSPTSHASRGGVLIMREKSNNCSSPEQLYLTLDAEGN